MNPRIFAVGALAWLSGCEVLDDIQNGVKAPEAALNRVDLIHAPKVDELLAWQCLELAGSDPLALGGCSAAGLDDKPREAALIYSFDLVFDLSNPNESLPIPLIEALLGMNVYDDQNLGSVCISFCDPEEEDCSPAKNAEDACRVDESDDVKGPEDLIPTVEDLVGLSEDVLEGNLDNGDWRWIEGGETVESHLRFDLSADVMIDLADELLTDAVGDVLSGRNVEVEVPYAADGTVFFDVPELGRKAIGFGPTANTWILE
jgi:hypothetical protein